MSRVRWGESAVDDLEETGKPDVVRRLLAAADNLCFPPREGRAGEGWIPGRKGVLAWCRPVRASADADSCDDEAADYVMVYRAPTDHEYRAARGGHVAVHVERVLPAEKLLRPGM
ncbi:hypothetical protein HTZ77_37415 [Nonomuraea sp. SMC257]|uniref:Uncharacterized protein n=1 Tax=Nonomuraea montanisoli TaxID=2741721 RepID=A0A7Y6IF35_9ACTN|nr:hypothetical protein [Nonomuraea montanisoli]NUW37042.1 hypothetical protein [Nonomuraea montanisoli]